MLDSNEKSGVFPDLADFKDHGNIEEDKFDSVNVFLLLWRDSMFLLRTLQSPAEIKVLDIIIIVRLLSDS